MDILHLWCNKRKETVWSIGLTRHEKRGRCVGVCRGVSKGCAFVCIYADNSQGLLLSSGLSIPSSESCSFEHYANCLFIPVCYSK